MDILAGTVPADPNLTSRMCPGMNTNIRNEHKENKLVCILTIRNISLLYSYS